MAEVEEPALTVHDVETEAAAVQHSLDAVSKMVEVLFQELSIQRIISVDDSWELDAEGALSVSARIFDEHDLLVEVVRLLGEFHEDLTGDLDVESPQPVADFLNRDWATLSPEFRRASLDAVRETMVDGDAIAEGQHGAYEPAGLVRLSELFRPFVELETVGHVAWRALFDGVAASDVGVLVLFDRDFSAEAGGATDTGEDLVRALLEVKNPLVRVAMLTRSVANEKEELEETRKLEGQLGVGAGQVVVVGKYRLGNIEALPGALRVMLLAEQIEAYRELAGKALSAAVEAAQAELNDLQRYTIMGAVASAQKEGVFELDPPLRLVRRAYERTLQITMRDSEFASRHLDAFRSGNAVSYLNAGEAGPQLVAALRADLFEDGQHINSLGLPIEIGDIFETSWLLGGGQPSKKFILLGQPCDISVRDKGARTPEIHTFTLHEFRLIEGDHDVRDGAVERLRSIGPYGDDLRPWGINLASQLPVPALALDATVFGPDGAAVVDVNYAERKPMADSWLLRYDEMVRQAKRLLDQYKKLTDAVGKAAARPEVASHMAAGVLGTAMSGKTGISGAIEVEKGLIRYGLQRVGRMLPVAAAGLLATAAAYQGRPAFDAPIAIERESPNVGA